MNGAPNKSGGSTRIVSIDALRGFVMAFMIYVNNLIDAPGDVVPPWMKHYLGPSGMTYPDVVFPAFLFIVGMSIPFALGGRINRGEPVWKTLLHVFGRAGSLLFIGVMMVNGDPDSAKMGWSGPLWTTLMYLCAFLAFCDLSPCGYRKLSMGLRVLGWAGLLYLALVFRNKNDKPLLTLWPFYIHHIWYGILGYIGWAYLVSSIVFLIFRRNLTAILTCSVIMMCLYPADKSGMFDNLWIHNHVNIGIALGSRAAITALGLLLGARLRSAIAADAGRRISFALLLALGCAAAALLLNGLYGTSKERGTPSWALYGCAITAVFWVGFYLISDVRPVGPIAKPLAMAGGNVLLPYLISEMLPSLMAVLGLGTWYDNLSLPTLPHAIFRGIACSLIIMSVSVGLNRLGFRLRL